MNTNQNTGRLTSRQPTLPTSRAATDQERGVLAVLRALAPRRRLAGHESWLLAELQANRLLEPAGLPPAPIPNELITELPRIVVRRDPDLPVSGSAHWASGRWQLTINGSEPRTRQRFTLAHEFKHCVDHPRVGQLYATSQEGEVAADHFAACLLMPKRIVTRVWGEGSQSLSELAQIFCVSPLAMARRLEHLGLRQRSPAVRPSRGLGLPGHYTRAASTRAIGASP